MDYHINKVYYSNNKEELRKNLNEYTKYVDNMLEGNKDEKCRLMSQIPLQE